MNLRARCVSAICGLLLTSAYGTALAQADGEVVVSASVKPRSTGGVITDANGEKRIRTLKLTSGRAAFRLISENYPKVVTGTVLSRNLGLGKAEIQVEFITIER